MNDQQMPKFKTGYPLKNLSVGQPVAGKVDEDEVMLCRLRAPCYDCRGQRAVLKGALHDAGFSAHDIEDLVVATGPSAKHIYGFTFSDLTQRLLPAIILDAYPNTAMSAKRAVEIAKRMNATPPFKEAGNE